MPISQKCFSRSQRAARRSGQEDKRIEPKKTTVLHYFAIAGASDASAISARRSRRIPGALGVDGIPPASVRLQGACDDDAVDDRENVGNIAGIDAAADQRRKRGGRADFPQIIEIGGVSGALAGE